MIAKKKYASHPRLEDGKWMHGPINFRLADDKRAWAEQITRLSREAERHAALRKDAEKKLVVALAEIEKLKLRLLEKGNA